MAKKKNAAGKADNLGKPRARGCLSCNRWGDFMHKVWESDHELCPEDGCIKLIEAKNQANLNQVKLNLPLIE